MLVAQFVAERYAVVPAEVYVEEEHIHVVFGEEPNGADAIGGLEYSVALVTEDRG